MYRSGIWPHDAYLHNKAIKFVPAYGLHRTPFSGRRLLLALGLPVKEGLQLRDLKQLIELAEEKERDSASLDEAIEIYELIINEHDYSHHSTTAAAALDRIEKGETMSARIAKRERSQVENILFRLAIIFYIASLVVPADGRFLAGTIMLIFSALGSVIMIPHALARIPNDPLTALSSVKLLLPFFNVLFFIALTRFWEAGQSRMSVFRVSLYACTLISIFYAAQAMHANIGTFYPFGLWAFAFLFLSLTVAICTEKNLTNAGKGRS